MGGVDIELWAGVVIEPSLIFSYTEDMDIFRINMYNTFNARSKFSLKIGNFSLGDTDGVCKQKLSTTINKIINGKWKELKNQ